MDWKKRWTGRRDGLEEEEMDWKKKRWTERRRDTLGEEEMGWKKKRWVGIEWWLNT